MIHKYNNFITNNLIIEGSQSSSNAETIYWNKQFDEIKNTEWSDFSTSIYSRSENIYYINFKTSEKDYKVLVKKKPGGEEFQLQDPTFFITKFKTDFWKNAAEYVKNFDKHYSPKCLGDLSHVKDSSKYNM